MKKIRIFLLSIIILFLIMILRTVFFMPSKNLSSASPKYIKPASKEAISNFSKGLTFKTISNTDYKLSNVQEFSAFLNYLQYTYPLIFRKTETARINDYALVLKLKGRTTKNKPFLITAHYDIVPESNDNNWKYPPFSGSFDGKDFYSRGALDDKASVFAILEALNELLKEDFVPNRDIYIAFSQDEETGKNEGAPKVVEYFKKKNIRFDNVLDEGGRIVELKNAPVAMVGVCEKGRLKTKITVSAEGSHASTPPKNTSVDKLAKLILAIKNNPIPAKMIDSELEYYKSTYNNYDFKTRFLIANSFLLKSLLNLELSKNKKDYARTHSTTTVTMLGASNASNVVAKEAYLIVDSRILPTQNCAFVKKHIEKVVNKTFKGKEKNNVQIEYLSCIEPSNISDVSSESYKKLMTEINNLYPGVVVVPTLTLGGTDARTYNIVADNAYRFLPAILTEEEEGLMHSDNERISLKNYSRMIYFYKHFIQSY